MRLKDHLNHEQRKQLEKLMPRKKPPSIKRDKPMSRKDWENLMGMNRDTYKRVRGAIRRK
ncbi:hypothetical protein B4102_0245 [Heyndrickxia sporothermodurans]|uniref:Uncharacterized protein n=1 Tax=Heyndrickxia sporothermodurans TaxID=46224 RepID=A0A150KSW8_9BACI|nr:hypothetical protein [Heyndrickxia sporothermodurans]KYD02651.1 hypothetical protein B4102_0245 [Heyndrickxia sporothermodurans]